ncbi:hypothetical protein [Pedobacter sp. FW305-3-2-15-E-R2A2]|jgi:hypothetical protein|uniref:hypothetical protein n=1 Tax=Pedobacter sp. FW305-3-2-15-E-R2A2 TaxID=3140251 RepID=UPI0031404C01
MTSIPVSSSGKHEKKLKLVLGFTALYLLVEIAGVIMLTTRRCDADPILSALSNFNNFEEEATHD